MQRNYTPSLQRAYSHHPNTINTMKAWYRYLFLFLMLWCMNVSVTHAVNFDQSWHNVRAIAIGEGFVYASQNANEENPNWQKDYTSGVVEAQVPFIESQDFDYYFYANPEPGNELESWYNGEECDESQRLGNDNPYAAGATIVRDEDKLPSLTLWAKFVKSCVHAYDDGSTAMVTHQIPATCVDFAYSYDECMLCHKQFNMFVDELSPLLPHSLNHDHIIAAREPTCSEYGNIAYKPCLVCGLPFSTDNQSLVDAFIERLPHDYNDSYTCLNCGNIYYRNTICAELNMVTGSLVFNQDQNLRGSQGNIEVFTGDDFSNRRWADYHSIIKSVRFHENFKVLRLSSLSGFFKNLDNLQQIDHLEHLVTTSVVDMSEMFCGCSSLTHLDLSSFDTRYVQSMSGMFSGCESLQSVEFGYFSMEKVDASEGPFTDVWPKVQFNSLPYLTPDFGYGFADVSLHLTDQSLLHLASDGATSYFPSLTSPATYTRRISPTTDWGTLILPFAVRSTAEYQLYRLSSISLDEGVFTFASAPTVPANTPCLFMKSEPSVIELTFVAADMEVATPLTLEVNVGDAIHKGTYVARTSATGNALDASVDAVGRDVYYLSGNQLWRSTGTVDIKAMRSWFELPHDAAAARLIIGLDAEAEGVRLVRDDADGTVRLYYDLQGRRVNHPHEGQVLIGDGRKSLR